MLRAMEATSKAASEELALYEEHSQGKAGQTRAKQQPMALPPVSFESPQLG